MTATAPVHADQHEGSGSGAAVLGAQRIDVEGEGDLGNLVATQAKPIAAAPQKLPKQGFALAQQLPVSSARASTGNQGWQRGRRTTLRCRRPVPERRLPVLLT